MVDDKYNRYNLTVKLDANITPWWKINSDTRLTNENRDRLIYNGEGGDGMIIHQVFRTHWRIYRNQLIFHQDPPVKRG